MSNIVRIFGLILIEMGLVLSLPFSGSVLADNSQSSSSANYKIDESFIGGGGLIQSNSTNYSGNESIGDIGVGESSSGSYQTNSSYTTTSDPALTFVVNTSSVSFGAFSTASTKTGTSTFSVINYTSYGYVILTVGSPPTNGSYTISGMTPAAPSSVGTEQFGINLKSNTSPATFGAEATGGQGVAASGYNTANNYKYVNGDTIASAPKSSAQTDFTMSYIVNVAGSTAGGAYTSSQLLVCVGTY